MTIAELEKESGLPRSTIHHYIRCGLLHDPFRTSQTMAYYDESHLRRLEAIRNIKDNFLKTSMTSRVPLDFIKSRIEEDYPVIPTPPFHQKKTEKKISEKKTKKKEEIIEVALELYSKNGYYRTNIKDITKKVGISAPTFYHYFPDKKELFVEVIEYVINDWKEKSRASLQSELDPAKRSIMLFQIFQSHYPKIGEILNHLRAGVVIGDRWAKNKLAQVYKELMENILELTKSSIERGVLRDLDPELLSYFFIVIDEAAVQRAALDDKYTIREILSFIANMIAYGFMTEKGRSEWLAQVQKKM